MIKICIILTFIAMIACDGLENSTDPNLFNLVSSSTGTYRINNSTGEVDEIEGYELYRLRPTQKIYDAVSYAEVERKENVLLLAFEALADSTATEKEKEKAKEIIAERNPDAIRRSAGQVAQAAGNALSRAQRRNG